MKAAVKYLLFLLIAGISAGIGQDIPSIHQMEWEQYRNLQYPESAAPDADAEIIPLQKRMVGSGSVIFGYLPDWEYLKGSQQYLRYDLLTHISAFDFNVSANGHITLPAGWPWSDVINTAHSNGVKVILTAVCFNKDDLHNLLTSETARDNFFENARSIMTKYQLDGINIDFEGFYVDDRGALLNAFMQALSDYMHVHSPDAEISFAGPAVNWGGWNLPGLAAACDYIFIMGYNYYWSKSSTSGPCSPLTGGYYNLTKTVDEQYAGIPTEKLILGLPYYGIRWQTESSQPYAATVKHVSHPRYYTSASESAIYGKRWDSKSKTPWYTYSSGSAYFQVWFDDDSSLGLKYELAKSRQLRGVGMWALGYDAGNDELWNALESHFYQSTSLGQADKSKPEHFNVFANYPDPFNNKTKIRYSLPANGEVKINIFNILGEKIGGNRLSRHSAGVYEWSWDAVSPAGSALPSGTYFYRIEYRSEIGDFAVKQGKMILLK